MPNKSGYSRSSCEKLILRDHLALERTMLSNERTFLAYVRTTLTLLIGGVGLINFFEGNLAVRILGIFFIIASFPIFFLGSYKFISKRKEIRGPGG
ncbi:MAG: DUF202 domain-containing protein [Candidatus Thermoplasmatota archaeon]|nr:DUF202 domain-containing protein [Candidatus Thermoplasmatota archaeon]